MAYPVVLKVVYSQQLATFPGRVDGLALSSFNKDNPKRSPNGHAPSSEGYSFGVVFIYLPQPPTSRMNKNILIVDDHEAARMGLASALDGAGFTVVGSVATGGEAIDAIKKLQIDLILMDVRMPQSDGLTTLGKIRKLTQAAIVMLSAYDNPTYVARATALGAQDYVVKSGENSELLDSLRLAVEGEGPAHQGRMARVQYEMQKEVRSDSLPKEFPLTSREGQVLRHIALGLSNKEIAKSLGISVETVKEHVQNVLRKVKANDRTDAAVRAIKSGLIS